MIKRKVKSYNDGVATVYKEKTIRTDFNAKVNAKTLDNYDKICTTYFTIETQRQDDAVFAEALGKKLDLKISVPFNSDITGECQVYINGVMYDIYRMDPDHINKALYIYLTEVRKFA